MKKGLIFILLLLLSTSHISEINAQDSTCCAPLLTLGTRFHKDFIIQHSRKLKDELVQTRPWSIEMDIGWHLRKREAWDYCYCYPRTGFAFQYINFDFPDVMGHAFALFPYIEPYVRPDKNLSVSFRFGIGPAILTKLYDVDTNPDNLFFSSTLSFISHLNLGVNYRFTDQLSMRLAANFHHISNGGISEPNLGMNFVSVNTGLDYNFKKATFANRAKDPDIVLFPNKNRFDLIAGFGVQPTPYTPESKLYPVLAIVTNYSRVLGRIFAVSAGLEFNNDRSQWADVRDKNITDAITGEYVDHKRFAATAGVEWLFGRFIFSPKFGYYLYSPYPAKHKWYQRYEINFKINDYLLTGVSIKAHAQDADFLDFRIGVFF